jgi:hypothetical protein
MFGAFVNHVAKYMDIKPKMRYESNLRAHAAANQTQDKERGSSS